MPGKVLIVEDDEYVGYVEQLMVEGNGYQAAWIRDGKSAKETARAERPDVIVMDVMLPGKDGFETADEIRAEPDLCEIPILFVSVLDRPVRDREAFHCAPVAYLRKPFEMEDFIGRIRDLSELAA
jgi:DNA-binding response OmpR family regulator